MMKKQLLIGTVLKPQGIRGEVKVKPYTDSPEVFRQIEKVLIDEKEYKIFSFRTDGTAVYLGLGGIADRNAAESLRGKNLLLDRKDAPDSGEGSYYIVDLIGCTVLTDTGKELGTLTSIVPAATDVYTVTKGEKSVLFPAVADLFEKISPEEGVIVVKEERFNQVAVL